MIKSVSRRRWIIRIIYCLFFIQAGSWFSLFGLFLQRNGLTGLQTGIILAIFPTTMLLFMPFWGIVADRYGKKRTLLFTAILTSLSYVVFVFSTGFWNFFLCTFLVALFYNPTMNSLLDSITLDYIETQKGINFGSFRVWGSIGYASGGLIAGRLMSLMVMKYIFVIAGLLLMAGWILLLFFKNEERVEQNAEKQKTNYIKIIFFDKKIAGFLALCIFIGITIQSVWGFQTTYLSSIGASNQMIGFSIMLQAISELPFYPISYFIIKRIGLVRGMSLSILFTAIRLALYGTVSNPFFAVLIELLQGFSFILTIIAAVEFLNHSVPKQWRATGQSLFASSYYGVGAIIGYWWAGYLIDKFDIQKMFLINAVIILVVFLFSLKLKNVKYESG